MPKSWRLSEFNPPSKNQLFRKMEISFPAHTVQDRFLTVPESDMATLYDVVKDCFLNHVKYGDFSRACAPHEKAVVNLCSKYQVDHTLEEDRVAFFKALLGVNSDPAPSDCNKI